ncbi:MAG: nucleoside 2-deoxyribosyltransferase domain-containing protein [Ginsengibacter sp.]
MKKVFLGGTCNGSKWRNRLIKKLDITYFQPQQEDWTPDMMDEEIRQREECDFCLYVITPKMEGFYSIAEVVEGEGSFTTTIFRRVPQECSG